MASSENDRASLAWRLLQGQYAKERVRVTATETAERMREATEAAKERAKVTAERWRGKLRSVVSFLLVYDEMPA